MGEEGQVRDEIRRAFLRADETTDVEGWLERHIDPLMAERDAYREALYGVVPELSKAARILRADGWRPAARGAEKARADARRVLEEWEDDDDG